MKGFVKDLVPTIRNPNVLTLYIVHGLVLFYAFVPLASPSMRGATPLDVAAASVMDNNELALALREPDLEKVSSFSVPSSTVLLLIAYTISCVHG